MRKWLILFWLMIPIGGIIYHYAHGRKLLMLDHAAVYASIGREAEKSRQWMLAEMEYKKALDCLPDIGVFQNERMQLQLAIQRTLVPRNGMLKAIIALNEMLAKGRGLSSLKSGTMNDIRAELAKLHYQASWLLRIQGASSQFWASEADNARAEYVCLARQASAAPSQQTWIFNAQAAIWLSRIELSELMGLPLPEESLDKNTAAAGMPMGSDQTGEGQNSKKGQASGQDDQQNQSGSSSGGNMAGNPDLASQFAKNIKNQDSQSGNDDVDGADGGIRKSPGNQKGPPGKGVSGGSRTGRGS